MWSHPRMQQFMALHATRSVHFDQCALGATAMKTTQLECTPDIYPLVYALFAALKCDHPEGTNDTLPGEMQASGEFNSSKYAHYPATMNQRLVECFVKSANERWQWNATPAGALMDWGSLYTNADCTFIEDDRSHNFTPWRKPQSPSTCSRPQYIRPPTSLIATPSRLGGGQVSP